MTNATRELDRMIRFALARGLLGEGDKLYARNLLLDALGLAAPEDYERDCEKLPPTLTPMLGALCDCAAEKGLIEDSLDERERYQARLAGLITPPPSAISGTFWARYSADGARAATEWFYELCRACDYIRVDQIAKNQMFIGQSPYGELEITINLSKPEKDPRDIAAQRDALQPDYPACMLCVENSGYAGRPGFPARQNHRMIPLDLNGKPWYMQYSPYLYYEEHCIVLNERHTPMHIDRANLENMFAFVDLFPHYFIGSNADLPIVGGSILSHDHFQGGRHIFPMDRAGALMSLHTPIAGVEAEVANWPVSCVRLVSADKGALLDLGEAMLSAWRGYSDPACEILAETDQPHNTITPTLRKDGDRYQLNLMLRNNRTTAEHPMGIFHPHADLHHVKKENIGLIEVMGLFILPGRLLAELSALAGYLTGELDISAAPAADSPLAKHYDWVRRIADGVGVGLGKEAADDAIRAALSGKCTRVLEDAGVYKLDERGRAGLLRFLETMGYREAKSKQEARKRKGILKG